MGDREEAMRARRLRVLALAAALALLIAVAAQSRTQRSADPIKIGLLTDCNGAWATFTDYTLAGAELALIERGAKVAGPDPKDGVSGARIAGRPIQLSFGCSDGSPVSALKEARRLVERVGVSALIGPANGDEELALQDYARRRPTVAFVNGSASLRLPHPAPNFFSFHADGAQWSAGTGSYAYNVLGWRRAVTITDQHSTFNWSQTTGFVAEFCSLGGTIIKRVGVPSGISDFSGVIAQLPGSGVDGVYVASTPSAMLLALIHAYPVLRQHLSRKLLVAFIETGNLLSFRSDRLKGLVYADRTGPGGEPTAHYATALAAHFPQLDPTAEGVFDQDYYVAMRATLQALKATKGALWHGERQFMAALAGVRLDTPNGPVRLDKSHQAITTTYLWQVKQDLIYRHRLLRVIPNVDRTFGGYLSDHDAAPSLSTPSCKPGHVPPWAASVKR
jgi:branched-chain amino acid transport system substrate-binding protein